MNTLYLMQGVPGSGKSYVAERMQRGFEHCHICSTDDYHFEDGKYIFKPHKLAEYHKMNLDCACDLLAQGHTVIVDNTNIQRWQCREYVKFAVERGIPVVFVRVTGNFQNTHGVPQEAINKMLASMEVLTVESVLASKAPWEK